MLVIDADFLITNHSVQRLKTLLIAEAIISLSLFYQLLCILHVDALLLALTLYIWAYTAVLVWTFIMGNARLFQCTVNDINSTFNLTFLVGVLDT